MFVRSNRSFQAIALFCALAAFSCATPGTSAADKPPIKIGMIVSLSGVAADQGLAAKQAMEAYLDDIHHVMAGRKVELVVENDATNPATAVLKAHKLIEQDHCNVITGLILTNIGYAVAPVTEKAQVPLVVSVSAADDLTQRKTFHWLVRSGMTCSGATYPFGTWVHQKLHYNKVATVGVDFPYGYEVVGGFQKTFEQAGGKVIQRIWVPFGFTDFTTMLKQISPDADAVFIITAGQSAEILPKEYAKLGIKKPIIAGGTSYDESILPALGDVAVGAVSVLGYSAALPTAANKHFVQAFHAKSGGQDPGYYAEGAWTSGMCIKAAAEAVKGNVENTQQFMAALRKVDIADTPGGPMKMDDHGSAIKNYYVRRVEKSGGGKLQNTVIETFPACSQFGKFGAAAVLAEPPFSKTNPPCKFCTDSK